MIPRICIIARMHSSRNWPHWQHLISIHWGVGGCVPGGVGCMPVGACMPGGCACPGVHAWGMYAQRGGGACPGGYVCPGGLASPPSPLWQNSWDMLVKTLPSVAAAVLVLYWNTLWSLGMEGGGGSISKCHNVFQDNADAYALWIYALRSGRNAYHEKLNLE